MSGQDLCLGGVFSQEGNIRFDNRLALVGRRFLSWLVQRIVCNHLLKAVRSSDRCDHLLKAVRS